MRIYPLALAVAAVVVLAGCGQAAAPVDTPVAQSPSPSADSTEAVTIEPSPVRDDPAGFAAPAIEGAGSDWEGVHFVSPTGNEGCAILGPSSAEPDLWGCALAAQDWAFPRDDPSDFCYDAQTSCGYGIEVTGADAPHPRYRGDPGFPAGITIFDTAHTQPPVATLPYGHSVTYGDVTCVSAPTGIACENEASGHGFTVSKAAYDLY
jgi:hypothetical protein